MGVVKAHRRNDLACEGVHPRDLNDLVFAQAWHVEVQFVGLQQTTPRLVAVAHILTTVVYRALPKLNLGLFHKNLRGESERTTSFSAYASWYSLSSYPSPCWLFEPPHGPMGYRRSASIQLLALFLSFASLEVVGTGRTGGDAGLIGLRLGLRRMGGAVKTFHRRLVSYADGV